MKTRNNKSRDVKKESGILALAPKGFGKSLSKDVKQHVADFYSSDEHSRMCPGQKEGQKFVMWMV